jgi:hypothetical protein
MIIPKSDTDNLLKEALDELFEKVEFQYLTYSGNVEPKYRSRDILYHKFVKLENNNQ